MQRYAPEAAEAFAEASSCYGETERWLAGEEAAGRGQA
jgi:hypothetical protein